MPRAGRRGLHRAAELACTRSTPFAPRGPASTCCARSRWRSRLEECRADDRGLPASTGVKLMIAYRLHFEEINLSVDRPGAPRPHRRAEVLQLVVLDDACSRGDIRTKNEHGRRHALRHRRLLHQRRALPVPRRADARSWRSRSTAAPARLAEIDESTGALLRFEGERVAAFVTSFNAADVALVPDRRHQGTAPRRSGLRVRRRPRLRADGRRQDDPQADRQARSVRRRSCCTSRTAS